MHDTNKFVILDKETCCKLFVLFADSRTGRMDAIDNAGIPYLDTALGLVGFAPSIDDESKLGQLQITPLAGTAERPARFQEIPLYCELMFEKALKRASICQSSDPGQAERLVDKAAAVVNRWRYWDDELEDVRDALIDWLERLAQRRQIRFSYNPLDLRFP